MRYLGLLCLLGLLGACALSPLQIDPKPKAAFGLAEVAQPLSFEVEVVNQLGTQVIGSRGGVYQNSSLIQLGPKLDSEVAKSVRFSLIGMGLLPFKGEAGGSDKPDLLVRVMLTRLQSSCSSPLLPNTLEQKLTLVVELDRQGQRYQQSFSRSATKRFAKLPSQQDHQQAVATLLEQGLLQFYRSEGVLAFIQGR